MKEKIKAVIQKYAAMLNRGKAPYLLSLGQIGRAHV